MGVGFGLRARTRFRVKFMFKLVIVWGLDLSSGLEKEFTL
jgi:hypothetical protein